LLTTSVLVARLVQRAGREVLAMEQIASSIGCARDDVPLLLEIAGNLDPSLRGRVAGRAGERVSFVRAPQGQARR
jgi:hypothetical protein